MYVPYYSGGAGGGGGRWGMNDSHFVFVDPHVLSSPSLADVNGDGDMELIMAVSYYFDKEDYIGNTNTRVKWIYLNAGGGGGVGGM